MFTKNKMGCLKLSYGEKNYTGLKVVYSNLYENENSCTGSYRYGFNGMEKDDELKGSGNSYTTEFREYDPRIGRWLSTDPMAILAPGWSPYRAFFCNPINYTDPTGLFETRKEAREFKKEHGVKGKITKDDEGVFTINGKDGQDYTFGAASTKPIEVVAQRGKSPIGQSSSSGAGSAPQGKGNWLDEVFWFGGKHEGSQPLQDPWRSSPNYKPTVFQQNMYGLADNAPFVAAGAVATPFVVELAIISGTMATASMRTMLVIANEKSIEYYVISSMRMNAAYQTAVEAAAAYIGKRYGWHILFHPYVQKILQDAQKGVITPERLIKTLEKAVNEISDELNK